LIWGVGRDQVAAQQTTGFVQYEIRTGPSYAFLLPSKITAGSLAYGPNNLSTAGAVTMQSLPTSQTPGPPPNAALSSASSPQPAPQETTAVGWPCLCLHARTIHGSSSPTKRGYLQLGPTTRTYRNPLRGAVPVLPLWPGLLTNTVFYAAALSLLFVLF